MATHSFTGKQAIDSTCLYSPAAKNHRPLASTHFTVPQRVEGGVDLGVRLGIHIEIKCRPRSRTRTRSPIPVLTGLSVG